MVDKKKEQEFRMRQVFCNMDQDNIKCVDCNSEPTIYASINNGILLCSRCAEIHKSFGNNISFIRQIGDKWDNYLLNFIKNGGNSRFKQFCKDYHIDNIDQLIKYKSKGLEYYREILKSEVMGYDPPNNIEIQSASQILYKIPNNYPEFDDYTFVKQVDINVLEEKYKEKPKTNILNSISGFFSSIDKKINNAADNFFDKVFEMTNNKQINEKKLNQDTNIVSKEGENQDMNKKIFANGDKENKETGKIDNIKIEKNSGILLDSKEISKIIEGAKEVASKNEKNISEENKKGEDNLNVDNKKIEGDSKNEEKNKNELDEDDELLKKIKDIENAN